MRQYFLGKRKRNRQYFAAMNSETTPTSSAKAPMSTSLKERLKRCGRYHSSSPATIPQQKHNLSSPLSRYDSSSSANLLPRRNPTKRKVDLCTDKDSSESEFLVTDIHNTLCSEKSLLPGKRKAAKGISELDYSVKMKTSSSGCNLELRDLNDSFTTCSQSQQSTCDSVYNDTVSNANSCIANCGKPLKHDSVYDRLEELPTIDNTSFNAAKEDVSGSTESDSVDMDCLISQQQQLDSDLKEKQELLRKLKMVKMYREKNDLTELQKLIDRWRSVSQAALSDLLDLHPEPRPQLGDLISHLQIDPGLVQFNAEDQDFHQ
ncbi:SWI5-dependent recombination repair 1 [Elysia marginata]|uniref:Swi5-dependent recombination DNA repair protein 1 homolog n=1 Tax=Elysia marginata TaxID=1093978 RepID=A0AAV4IZY3_9GAST|nr:SWI5-dependent recombination repair 1 [Elysia marginata]